MPWEDMYDMIYDVNLRGVMNTVMPMYKNMKTRGTGQIALLSSINAFFAPPEMAWYNSSKAALFSFARDFRTMARYDGIHVSCVCPGFVDTPLTQPISAHSSVSRKLWLHP